MSESLNVKNNPRKTVVVQGLGFVGAVMSIVVANSSSNYEVIGVDLPSNQDVINNLNSGNFPIESSDPKIQTYFKRALEKNNFRATSDEKVYCLADIVIVDINLDVQKNTSDEFLNNDYTVNLNGFKKAMYSIAENCKQDVLVLVETTVPPGTCEKIVKPIFEEVFDRRGIPHQYKIGHSYERVMPGPNYIDSIQNFYRVYSGINELSALAVESFLKTIISTKEYPLTRLGNTTATEMAKVLENSFRAMNIAFIQEWTNFAEIAGVNLHEVIDAIRMRPTHKNIMRPGLGVGGYCLTKDPLLASWASQALFGGVNLTQSEISVKINDFMPNHSFRIVKKSFSGELKGKKILILGVSYLADIGDTRYTPVETIYKGLLLENVDITLHDPYVSFWQEQNVNTDSDEAILNKTFDAVFLGTPHSKYLIGGFLEKVLLKHKELIVFDPHGAISNEIKEKFSNNLYKIIGRGDV
jgi:UDP-N-acetyl-D-glucosamine dehydrogenase